MLCKNKNSIEYAVKTYRGKNINFILFATMENIKAVLTKTTDLKRELALLDCFLKG